MPTEAHVVVVAKYDWLILNVLSLSLILTAAFVPSTSTTLQNKDNIDPTEITTSTNNHTTHALFFDTGSTSVTVTKATNPPPPNHQQPSALLALGLVAGGLFIGLLTLSMTVLVVVIRRRNKKKSSAVEDNVYDYVTSMTIPRPSDMIDNSAYGCLEASIPGKLGVFTAPAQQPNVSYGVLDSLTTSSSNGYELTDTLQYEEPQYTSLNFV